MFTLREIESYPWENKARAKHNPKVTFTYALAACASSYLVKRRLGRVLGIGESAGGEAL